MLLERTRRADRHQLEGTCPRTPRKDAERRPDVAVEPSVEGGFVDREPDQVRRPEDKELELIVASITQRCAGTRFVSTWRWSEVARVGIDTKEGRHVEPITRGTHREIR